MTLTSTKPLAAKPAMKRRASARADGALKTATRPAMIDAIAVACAAFASDDGRLLVANRTFSSEFDASRIATRDAFSNGFDDYAARRDDAREHEVFDAASGRWYALTWVSSSAGGVACDVVTAINITERMDALRAHTSRQEKLLFTSRFMSVGEMATTLAHELNQPLAAIMNYLNVGLRLIDDPAQHGDRLGEAIRYARAQAEHAAAVIARIREFVRAREPKLARHALGDLVKAVLDLLVLEAERHRVDVTVDISGNLPDVEVDRVMVEQVLLNLIKNAIEAMRESPSRQRKLSIGARLNLDEAIEVRVADRGCGLSPTQAEQLFTPFFTTKPDGLGVGLSICRSIIEYHGGRLFFENNPEGGSVFAFTLPPASA
jgi:C4-dicarboxylate-specific signal transduction histidine kinase